MKIAKSYVAQKHQLSADIKHITIIVVCYIKHITIEIDRRIGRSGYASLPVNGSPVTIKVCQQSTMNVSKYLYIAFYESCKGLEYCALTPDS